MVVLHLNPSSRVIALPAQQEGEISVRKFHHFKLSSGRVVVDIIDKNIEGL